jgi:hypothetical protein
METTWVLSTDIAGSGTPTRRRDRDGMANARELTPPLAMASRFPDAPRTMPNERLTTGATR